MSTNINFKDFMDQVEMQLKTYSLDNLREIILEWARNTHPSKRSEFLAKLVLTPPEPKVQEPDDELLEEIDDLAKRVKDGDYSQGWGWDDEIQEERDWGDESWVDEVDEFFSRTYESLTAGHYELARDAYARLFDILEMGQEPGHLPGNPDPQKMLDTDLGEAQACYLRSVYLSSPPHERPTELLEAMKRFGYQIGDEFNLRSIVNAEWDPLPDFTLFLSSWIELLKRTSQRSASYLLREAIILSGGTSAIAELARNEGNRYPRAYVDWIIALEKDGDFRSMFLAAKEGLTKVPKDYAVRAEIAEGMVRAGESLHDMEGQLAGWHEAFHSHPSLSHLLSLLSVAGQKGCSEEEIETVFIRIVQLIEKGRKYQVRSPLEDADLRESTASGGLLNQAYLLAGRYEDVFNTCQDKEALGWIDGDPEELAIPFFLVLLSRRKGPHSPPNVERLWKEAISNIRGYNGNKQDTSERFLAAMDKVVRSIQLSEDEQNKYLRWSIGKIGSWVDDIVGNKNRYSYDKAANLLVALAEVLANRNMKSDGSNLIDKYRQKYNHYSAFQKELNAALKESSIFAEKSRKT